MKPFRILGDTTAHTRNWEQLPARGLVVESVGELWFPKSTEAPYIIRNDAVTNDGIMSLKSHPGPAVITGGFANDMFVVALLRSIASAVLIGANTLAEETEHLWVADEMLKLAGLDSSPFPRVFAEMRTELHLPTHPTLIVLTRSGKLPAEARVYSAHEVPMVVCTTVEGRTQIPHAVASRPNITILTYDGVHLAELIPEFARLGLGRIIVEAGPTVASEFMKEQLIHEEWTTTFPRILGTGEGRSGRVTHPFAPGSEPMSKMLTLRSATWETERHGETLTLPVLFQRSQIVY